MKYLAETVQKAMRIKLEKHNPEWKEVYNNIQNDLRLHLTDLNPVIEQYWQYFNS